MTSLRFLFPAMIGLAALGLGTLVLESSAVADDNPRVAARANGERQSHPLDPALRVARSSLYSIQQVDGYVAVFKRRELVGRELLSSTMTIKLRHEPFSVYLRFHGEHDGREVIYVEGRNQGNLLAHETGLKSLVGTVSLAPTSTTAMKGSRYPVTRIGMKELVEAVIEQWEAETKIGSVQVKYYPNAKLDDIECKVIETSHPVRHSDANFQLTRLYIDRKSNLPVRLEQYGFPASAGARPPLVEEYTYSGIRLDPGLTDRDFDARNPAYDF
jgi:hypothetical protein